MCAVDIDVGMAKSVAPEPQTHEKMAKPSSGLYADIDSVGIKRPP